jgi:hypothetical protein
MIELAPSSSGIGGEGHDYDNCFAVGGEDEVPIAVAFGQIAPRRARRRLSEMESTLGLVPPVETLGTIGLTSWLLAIVCYARKIRTLPLSGTTRISSK